MHIRRSIIAPPDFWWNFRSGALHSAMSFTRASAGWTMNASGLLEQKSTDVTRFYHDPVTGAPWGLLSEMQSTNNCIYSSDSGAWTTSGIAFSTDGTLGPDGTTLAAKVTASAGAGNHFTNRGAIGQGAGNPIVMSAFVKQGTARYVVLVFSGDSPWHSGTFDFQTGAWIGTGTTVTLLPPIQFAGGWWRLAAAWTPVNNVGGVGVGPSTQSSGTVNDISYTAAGTETVYTTGWQVDTTGVGLTSYIPTNGSTVTRAQDICSIPLSSIGFDAAQAGVVVGVYRHHSLYPTSPGYANELFYMTAGAWQNSIQGITHYASSSTARSYMVSGGADQYFLSLGASKAPFVRSKMAVSWGTARAGGAVDGGAFAGASGSYSLPAVTPTTLYIGNYADRNLQGTLESIAYYKGARADAFISSVSR